MTSNTPEFALSLERRLAVPRSAVWRCWTEPALLCQWFCPKPWGVSHADIELHAGGRFFTHMVGPNGEQMPNAGVFLHLARALHWSEADMQQHEAMGFHEGWAAATRQLEELAATL
ncbi:MAG: hypothetical protein EBR58_05105 [Betaproteobacteria bacterium]|nr:hypothetical protein [Betaproteobacteria bacterium]